MDYFNEKVVWLLLSILWVVQSLVNLLLPLFGSANNQDRRDERICVTGDDQSQFDYWSYHQALSSWKASLG